MFQHFCTSHLINVASKGLYYIALMPFSLFTRLPATAEDSRVSEQWTWLHLLINCALKDISIEQSDTIQHNLKSAHWWWGRRVSFRTAGRRQKHTHAHKHKLYTHTVSHEFLMGAQFPWANSCAATRSWLTCDRLMTLISSIYTMCCSEIDSKDRSMGAICNN